MSWAALVSRNLFRRRARTALTAAGVSVAVGLIVALLSITAGVQATAQDLIHVGRSDFGLFQDGAPDLTRSLLPDTLAAKVARVPGVAADARLFLLVSKVENQDSFLLFGLARTEFPYRRLVIVAGRRPIGNEVLLGDQSPLKLAPGQLLHIGGHAYRIAGLYHTGDHFEDIGAVLPLATVQALAGRSGEVTTIPVTVKLGASPKLVARRLERAFPGVTAITEPGQAVKVDTSSRLIIQSGWIFSLLALIVGGIAVTNTMAMSVLERVGEIGLLRAVGWRGGRIALLILSEAAGIGLIALACGLLLGWAGAVAFTDRGALSSLVQPQFTAGVFAWALGFALAVGLLGASYPAWRAIRLTPIEALRHE